MPDNDDSQTSQDQSIDNEKLGLESISMGMNDRNSLWGSTGGFDADFQNKIESQIRDASSSMALKPLTMTLRDESLDSEKSLIYLDRVNMNRGRTVTRKFSSNIIVGEGEHSITYSDYDMDFSFKLKLANGNVDLVNFSLSDFLHLIEEVKVNGSLHLPTSTVDLANAVPNFIMGFLTNINPNLSSEQITQNHLPQEIEKEDGEISLFQKGCVRKDFHPLCCTISEGSCPRLKDIHPLPAEKKRNLQRP